MGKPVLDYKFGTALENLLEYPQIGDVSVFQYKNELWTITIVGITEEDLPMFTIDIEERGAWHETSD